MSRGEHALAQGAVFGVKSVKGQGLSAPVGGTGHG